MKWRFREILILKGHSAKKSIRKREKLSLPKWQSWCGWCFWLCASKIIPFLSTLKVIFHRTCEVWDGEMSRRNCSKYRILSRYVIAHATVLYQEGFTPRLLCSANVIRYQSEYFCERIRWSISVYFWWLVLFSSKYSINSMTGFVSIALNTSEPKNKIELHSVGLTIKKVQFALINCYLYHTRCYQAEFVLASLIAEISKIEYNRERETVIFTLPQTLLPTDSATLKVGWQSFQSRSSSLRCTITAQHWCEELDCLSIGIFFQI